MATKLTLVPLDWVNPATKVPFSIERNLEVRNVENLLRPKDFSLWKSMIAENELNDLPSFRYAIVHSFESSGHIGLEEATSRDLAHETFVALRLVHPTRTRYASYQCRVLDGDKVDVFSFRRPLETPVSVPESEVLNTISTENLELVRQIIPSFRKALVDRTTHLYRAINNYELGYVQPSPWDLQFVCWMIGIESALSHRVDKPRAQAELREEIVNLLGPDMNIYADSGLGAQINLPTVSVREVLPDMFRMRNELIHGRWIPKLQRSLTRRSLVGEPITYAQIVTEAAPVILRKIIMKMIADDFKHF